MRIIRFLFCLGIALSMIGPAQARVVQAESNATITAGLSSAVYDTDFLDSFAASMRSGAINLTMADLQSGIGDGVKARRYVEGDLAHAALHGLVGCAAGEALGGNCASGFAAGVAQSVFAGMLHGTGPDKSDTEAHNAWRAQVANQAELIGAGVGYITSGGLAANVSGGGSIARSGAVHNYLSHLESWALERAREELGLCQTSGDCDPDQIMRLQVAVSELEAIDQQRDDELRKACEDDPQGFACATAVSAALIAIEYYHPPETAFPGVLGDTGYAQYARLLENGLEGHPRAGFVEDVYAHRERAIKLLEEFRPSVDYTQTQLANANGIAVLAAGGGIALALAPELAAGAALLSDASAAGATYAYVMCTSGGACTTAMTGLAAAGVGMTAYELATGDPSALGIAASGPYGTLMAVEEIAGLVGMFRTGRVVGAPNRTLTQYPDGTFSVSDWSGYPAGVPRPPEGTTYWLLSGSEYSEARRLANNANAQLRRSGVVPEGYQIHEIVPVKYGGSPTDPANKVYLPRGTHRSEVTPWWNRLQRDLER